MASARPTRGAAGGIEAEGVEAGAVWLVLDLAEALPPDDPAAALAELGRAVAGVTVLVRPGAAVASLPARVHEVAGDAAERLARAAARLPDGVDVIVWGDRRLLAADERGRVAAVLARWRGQDAVVARGVPVTDSLRRVDGRGRLVECVDRTGLVALRPPHALRREVAPEIAALAAAGDADGGVESGLLRAPWPVRVVDLDAAADVDEAPAAAGRSRAG